MPDKYILFGDSKPFIPPPWTTTDDRVRGGSSRSHLSAIANNGARFYGDLDIKTLGGAGFASQFSPLGHVNTDDATIGASNDGDNCVEDEMAWDLGEFDGIQIDYGASDGKAYTFIIKDEKSDGKRDDGREKASINWEVEFTAEKAGGKVWKPWGQFKAFYRGKEQNDAGNLKTGQVRRVGLMMRSYFGNQEGIFSLEVKSISAQRCDGSKTLRSS